MNGCVNTCTISQLKMFALKTWFPKLSTFRQRWHRLDAAWSSRCRWMWLTDSSLSSIMKLVRECCHISGHLQLSGAHDGVVCHMIRLRCRQPHHCSPSNTLTHPDLHWTSTASRLNIQSTSVLILNIGSLEIRASTYISAKLKKHTYIHCPPKVWKRSRKVGFWIILAWILFNLW